MSGAGKCRGEIPDREKGKGIGKSGQEKGIFAGMKGPPLHMVQFEEYEKRRSLH